MMSTSLRLFNTIVNIDNYNDDFLIMRSAKLSEIAKIGKGIFQKKFDFIDEVIVTEVEICLKLNASFHPTKLASLITIEISENIEPRTFRLPVYFKQHDDWAAVSAVTGFTRNEVIEKLCTTEFTLSMFGFLPGFLYLDGLDASLHVPRKKVPDKYVEANSVAIGGKYLGLYAVDSPGGWQVIGKTPIRLLQLPQLPPVDLNPGDQIKIHAIENQEYEELYDRQLSLKDYDALFGNC